MRKNLKRKTSDTEGCEEEPLKKQIKKEPSIDEQKRFKNLFEFHKTRDTPVKFCGKRNKPPKLDKILTADDKKKLSKNKSHVRVCLKDLKSWEASDLHSKTGINLDKCQQLISMSIFQTMHGISQEASLDLWHLGFKTLDEVSSAEPNNLYKRMNEKTGSVQDPCVEDTFRGAIAQSYALTKHNWVMPSEKAQWWHWGGTKRGQSLKELQSQVDQLYEKQKTEPTTKPHP